MVIEASSRMGQGLAEDSLGIGLSQVAPAVNGRRRESADALSVVALGVPAATELAFFPSGVRHSGGV